MVRWLAWFGVGAVLFFAFGVLMAAGRPQGDGLRVVLALLFWSWCFVTLGAVPIAVGLWLFRGRRRSVTEG